MKKILGFHKQMFIISFIIATFVGFLGGYEMGILLVKACAPNIMVGLTFLTIGMTSGLIAFCVASGFIALGLYGYNRIKGEGEINYDDYFPDKNISFINIIVMAVGLLILLSLLCGKIITYFAS